MPHAYMWRRAVHSCEVPIVPPINAIKLSLCGVAFQAEEGGDEYGGAKPFSEPETRIVRLLAETTRPQVSDCPSMPVMPAGCTAVACMRSIIDACSTAASRPLAWLWGQPVVHALRCRGLMGTRSWDMLRMCPGGQLILTTVA